MLLDWLQDNLLTDAEAAKTTLTSVVNEALPFAVRAGAAAVWLIKHGADTSVLKKIDVLRAALQGYLVETLQLSLPLVQHVSSVDKNGLNNLLLVIANNSPGIHNDVSMIEHLQALGAKLTAQEWQDILYSTLTQSGQNWVMANLAVAQGADINTLDLNNIINRAIAAAPAYSNTSQEKHVDIVSLFYFLRIHGVDSSKLDVAQLRSIAEEKNNTAAIEQLKKVNRQVKQIPAEEILQQLYKELIPPPTTLAYDTSDDTDFLLHEAVKDYWDKKSFVWLLLYVEKVRGKITLMDMVEVIRFTPYLGSLEYNEKMDEMLVNLGLAEQKEELAQVLLKQIFDSEEIHPFPLSFARWAVSNGADINDYSPHAVVRAIINNAEIWRNRGDYHQHIRPPVTNDIIFFLRRNDFPFDEIDKDKILKRVGESEASTYVLENIEREKGLFKNKQQTQAQ